MELSHPIVQPKTNVRLSEIVHGSVKVAKNMEAARIVRKSKIGMRKTIWLDAENSVWLDSENFYEYDCS